MLKVIVCGPRRSTQGIGEYIAKFFHLAGTKVVGVVSTTKTNSEKSVLLLKEKYGINCNGYLSLEKAIEIENPDIIVICTPIATHQHLLETAIKYEKHCLCEKPLIWPFDNKKLGTILDGFRQKRRFFDVVTQWPCTLPYFYQIYPNCSKKIQDFKMVMGPISIGKQMVIDAMPHILSMLTTLTGSGLPKNIECQRKANQMLITFDYQHLYKTKVTCCFIQTEEQPRPASYSINGFTVDRHLDLKNYQIYLQNDQHKVKIEDPLFLLVQNYISHINQNLVTDGNKLMNEMESLSILYENI